MVRIPRSSSRSNTIAVAFAVAVFAGAVIAQPAWAQADPQLDDTALVDQYREDVPTAAGPKITGGSAHGAETAALPNGLVRSMRDTLGRKDAARLGTVVSDARFGAPMGVLSVEDAATSEPSPFSAAMGALDGGGRALGALFPVLVAITAALFGAAFYRRRQGNA